MQVVCVCAQRVFAVRCCLLVPTAFLLRGLCSEGILCILLLPCIALPAACRMLRQLTVQGWLGFAMCVYFALCCYIRCAARTLSILWF